MTTIPKILVVDDDEGIRVTVAMLLVAEGYEIITAADGFDALAQMRCNLPDLVVSDLNMPCMSGFEFLSVIRRRFPQVLVVATSGDAVPGNVIADAFYAKGVHSPRELIRLIADLLRYSSSPALAHIRQSAPVWVPRNGKDTDGKPYIMLTCPDCLRSFPINIAVEVDSSMQEVACHYCFNAVRFIIDSSLTTALPRKMIEKGPPLTSRASG